MAWSMPDETEKFTVPQMVENFDLKRVSLGGPVFDQAKLTWLNERYIREDYDKEGFAKLVTQWALNSGYLDPMIELVQPRAKVLSDLGQMTAFFFSGMLELELADFTEQDKDLRKVPQETMLQWLQWGLWRLEALRTWDAQSISAEMQLLAEHFEVKQRVFNKPFFVALSGTTVSTPLYRSMEVLGADMTRARLRHGVKALTGGVGLSGKKQKKWKKSFDSAFRR